MDFLTHSVGSGQRSLRGTGSLALAQMIRAVFDQHARSLASVATFFETSRATPCSTATMIKHILLLAAVIGFIAQSSVYAADPTPAPTESATPHHGKHHHHHHASPTPAPKG